MAHTAPPGSSPRKRTATGFYPYSNKKVGLEERRLQLTMETVGHIIGSVPPKDFLDSLLPLDSNAVDEDEPIPMRAPKADFSKVPTGAGKEVLMYEPFMNAIRKSKCCPSFRLQDTSSVPDTITGSKPDCGLFNLSFSEAESKKNSMATMDIPVEMKPQFCKDAFGMNVNDKDTVKEEAAAEKDSVQKEENSPGGRHSSATGDCSKLSFSSIKHRGQQIDYATQIMALQHRSHVFSISVIGHYARLVRWDRAGAVVSDCFNYADGTSNWLSEFLFRYERASREQRGFDDHFKRASDEEVHLLKAGVESYLKEYSVFQNSELSQTVDKNYPAYKVRVSGQVPDDEREYIICRPFTEVVSLCGRATRGYLAWGMTEGELLFLKDTWRANVEGVLSEAEVYKTLSSLPEIAHLLPTVLRSGDVLLSDGTAQRTLTHEYASTKFAWYRPTAWLREHVRHRVVQRLALPLRVVRNSKELLTAIRNALTVIREAFKVGILHRDVSAGNVMLNGDFLGILNDWDHAINVLIEGEGHAYRSGTWQFMSIQILQAKRKTHSIHDDVESCFWVLYNTALRFFPRTETSASQQMAIFDECEEEIEDGRVYYVGGGKKLAALDSNHVYRVKFISAPLTRAIHDFAQVIEEYNRALHEVDKWLERKGKDSKAYINAVAALETHARKLADVDPIIEIIDEAIESSDWPEDDGTLPDQHPPRTWGETIREIAEAQEEGFAKDASLRSQGPESSPLSSCESESPPPASDTEATLSRPPSPGGLIDEKKVDAPAVSRKAQRATPMPRPTRSVFRHAHSFPMQPPLPSASKPHDASLKRSYDEGPVYVEEGTSDGRVKRMRKVKEKPAPTKQYNTRSRKNSDETKKQSEPKGKGGSGRK